MMDHSPLPWQWDAHRAEIVAADGRVVAKVAHFLRHGSYEATIVDDANARLIIAAVERLTALTDAPDPAR